MNIPIFYWIRVANSTLVKSMKESKLPEAEALELYREYMGNKRKYLKRLMIFAFIFLIGASFILIGESILPNEAYVIIPLLIALFIGVFGTISSFNKYSVSNAYVEALQKGYPNIAERSIAG